MGLAGIDVGNPAIEQLCSRLGVEPVSLEDVVGGDRPLGALECLVLAWEERGSRELFLQAQHEGYFQDTPVVAVVNDPWGRFVGEAFSAGIDDFIGIFELAGLERKIAAMLRCRAGAPREPRS